MYFEFLKVEFTNSLSIAYFSFSDGRVFSSIAVSSKGALPPHPHNNTNDIITNKYIFLTFPPPL